MLCPAFLIDGKKQLSIGGDLASVTNDGSEFGPTPFGRKSYDRLTFRLRSAWPTER